MTEPTHDPAPVELPDVDLTASIPCEREGCTADPIWRYRLRCPLGHDWILLCLPHAQEISVHFERKKRWQCVAHRNPLPVGKPIEWRPL